MMLPAEGWLVMVRLVNICSRSAVPILDQPQLIYLLTEIRPEPATTSRAVADQLCAGPGSQRFDGWRKADDDAGGS